MNFIAKTPAVLLPEEQIAEILELLRPLLRLSESRIKKQQSDGITPAMQRVLSHLQIQGDATVPALARTLGTGRQHVQRVVNELLALGLLERRENPAHKKSLLIALTDEGCDNLDRIEREKKGLLENMTEGLTDDDLQCCLEVMGQLIASLEDSETSKSAPVTKSVRENRQAPPEKIPEIEVLQSEPENGHEPALKESETVMETLKPVEPEHHEGPVVLNWNGGGGLGIP